MNVLFAARVQRILEDSITGLPDEDRAARIAYCRATGEHGIRVLADGDVLRFSWGGQPLAVVERSVFDDDAYLQPLAVDMVGVVPDDPRELSDP